MRRLSMESCVRFYASGRIEATVLAKELGVSVETLNEATEVQKLGAANRLAKTRLAYILFAGPKATHEKLVAKSVFSPSSQVRSLLHAAMLTTYEPARRPMLPAGAATPKKQKKFKQVGRGLFKINVAVSKGLHDAVLERAHAYGVRPHRYVMLWVLDFLAGATRGKFDIVPTGRHDVLPLAENYVLPRVAKPQQTG